MSTRPLPVPGLWSAPFWQAARERRLVIQHCTDCANAHTARIGDRVAVDFQVTENPDIVLPVFRLEE